MIVNTEGPAGADIMIVGEAPGAEEERDGKPFVGAAGRTLSSLLQQSGISRHSCLVTNVARVRPPGNDITLYFHDKQCNNPRPEMVEWVQQLKDEIELHRPNVIIALGNTALWALTGERGISSMRGYLLSTNFLPKTKIIPTFHPQAVNYDWKLHYTCILDLRKAARHSLSSDFPLDMRKLHAAPSYSEFMSYLDFLIANPTKPIAIDIETSQPGSHIHTMGIADSPTNAYSFKILNGHEPIYSVDMELALWSKLNTVLSTSPTE